MAALADIDRPASKKELPKLFETQAILAEYFPNAKLSAVDIEYSELNSAMSLSKKDPLKIITAYDLLKRTNWPWHESKNAKRDWKPLIRSTIVETKYIEKYRPILLKMHAGRFLRTKLQLLLAEFVFPKTVQDQVDGKTVTHFEKKWNYPDNMVWRALQEFAIDFKEELERVQYRSRHLVARKDIAAIVAKIETFPLSRVGPEKSHTISPGVQRAVTSLIHVSVLYS